MKAREPFLSSGEYYEDSQSTLKGIVMNILETIEKNMHSYDIDKETIQENHKKSLEAVMMPMFAMEYK